MRLARIEVLIRETTDRRKLKTLNRAWWKEYFRLEREQALEMIRKKAA